MGFDWKGGGGRQKGGGGRHSTAHPPGTCLGDSKEGEEAKWLHHPLLSPRWGKRWAEGLSQVAPSCALEGSERG